MSMSETELPPLGFPGLSPGKASFLEPAVSVLIQCPSLKAMNYPGFLLPTHPSLCVSQFCLLSKTPGSGLVKPVKLLI